MINPNVGVSTETRISSVSVMAYGNDLQINALNGYGPFNRYIKPPSNDTGIIHNLFINRFGNCEATPTQPVEN